MMSDLETAISVLKNGGVVVFPTETAYAIGCDARDSQAVEKVMAIKGRDCWKTPPVIAADLKMVEQEVELTDTLRELADQFWPGPLTIVAHIRSSSLVSPLVLRENTIAIRVSSDEIARELSKAINAPIVSTSANLCGGPNCYRIEEVQAQLGTQLPQPDYFLDGGLREARPASTIVKEENGEIVVLRQGSIDICNEQRNRLDRTG